MYRELNLVCTLRETNVRSRKDRRKVVDCYVGCYSDGNLDEYRKSFEVAPGEPCDVPKIVYRDLKTSQIHLVKEHVYGPSSR